MFCRSSSVSKARDVPTVATDDVKRNGNLFRSPCYNWHLLGAHVVYQVFVIAYQAHSL